MRKFHDSVVNKRSHKTNKIVVENKIIAMAGYSGMIGQSVTRLLENCEILPVTRKDFTLNDQAFIEKYSSADVVMNFAGENIIRRWTKTNKGKIMQSRVTTTEKMAMLARKEKVPVKLFISASAIGIYDTAGIHSEDKWKRGTGFMADLVEKWEEMALSAVSNHTRVCIMRLGIVLSEDGGVIRKLKNLFKWRLGAVIGNGQQHFSFIHIEDLKGIITEMISEEKYSGIYNIVAPRVYTNREFTRCLASALNRQAWLRIPEFLLRIIFGKGASVLTRGQAVIPHRLIQSGYKYYFPDLESSLKDLVN